MGCHTWIYIPKRDLREEDIAHLREEKIKEIKNNWVMNMTLDDYLSYEKTQYDGPKTFEEELPKYKDAYKRWHDKCSKMLNNIEADKDAIVNIICDDLFTVCVEVDGETYYNLNVLPNGDSIFRVCNQDAPEELVLTSKQDIIEYAKNAKSAYVMRWTDGSWNPMHNDEEGFIEHVEAELDELYSKWPHAVIDFG